MPYHYTRIVLSLLGFIGLSLAVHAQNSVVRTAVDDASCAPRITLAVTALPDICFITVEEILPTGLIAKGISDAGEFDPNGQTVRWAFLSTGDGAGNCTSSNRTLSYSVSGDDGIYPAITGSGVFDLAETITGGEASITIDCPTFNFSLDVDGNGSVHVNTDGILLLRYLFGFTGTALTQGVCDPCMPQPVSDFLAAAKVRNLLDVDGNYVDDALTDGLLTMRYMAGLRDNALIANAVGQGCARCTPAEITAFLNGFSSPLTAE